MVLEDESRGGRGGLGDGLWREGRSGAAIVVIKRWGGGLFGLFVGKEMALSAQTYEDESGVLEG